MKLVVNINCYNEEKTLPLVLNDIPKKIPGIDKIEVQIVDDGSTDKTVEVAKKHGCIVIRHKINRGLGRAFNSGVLAALKRGCDIMVNSDGDNQYPSRYIPALVKPILESRADMVVGNRTPWKVKHFSLLKRALQYFGNILVRKMIQSPVRDTVSGFRSYSREALLRINVTSQFSYVLDTLMQAASKGLKIINYDIKTNAPTRKSRLFKNIFEHMRKSTANLIRVFYLYQPFKTFITLSLLSFLPGLFLFIRFFYFYFTNAGYSGYIQSLIIATLLVLGSVLFFVFGIIGDSIKTNRTLIEEGLYLSKRELTKKK